jgi:hypothetical protein
MGIQYKAPYIRFTKILERELDIYDDKDVNGDDDGGRWSHPEATLAAFLKGICPRGNNNVVIIIFHVYDKCLFLMLELY